MPQAAQNPLGRPQVVSVAVVKFDDDPDKRNMADVATGKPPCRDGGFALLFVIQAAIIAVMAVVYGFPEYAIFSAQHKDEVDSEDETSSSGKKSGSPFLMLALIIATCIISGAASLTLFSAALKNPVALIQFGLRGLIFFFFSLTVFMLMIRSILGVILFALATALMVWYVNGVQDRVPFAAANLSIATAAIKKYRGTVRVAAWALLFQFIWVLTWLLACVGYGMRHVRARQSNPPEPSPAYDSFVHGLYGDAWDEEPPSTQSMGLREPKPRDLGYEGAAEYYGLYAGCRAIVYAGSDFGAAYLASKSATDSSSLSGKSDLSSSANDLDRSSGTGNDISPLLGNVYCACGFSGSQVSSGQCDGADYAKQEVAAHFLIYLGLLLCLFWGSKVISGVVHVTSAGTVAAWWFGADAYVADVSDTVAYSELETAEVSGSAAGASGGGDTVPEAKPLNGQHDEETGSVKSKKTKKVKRSKAERGGVVRAALRRALGPSFGSICFGCLIVAILSTLESLMSMLRNQASGDGQEVNLCTCCLCCIELVLSCIQDIVEYFNRWAFTYVAVYGDDFVSAGKATNALFKRRGWTNIIADQLCSIALSSAAICIAIGKLKSLCPQCLLSILSFKPFPLVVILLRTHRTFLLVFPHFLILFVCLSPLNFAFSSFFHVTIDCGNSGAFFVALLLASILGLKAAVALAGCSFFAAWLMCSCLLAVLDSGVLTTLVCFAEDPRPCAELHPEEFGVLIACWKLFYGPELERGGYDRLW